MKNNANKFIVLQEVDSTNNYANSLILTDKAEEGAAVLAHYQKKGRGQAQNTWESQEGKNLLLSVILFPKFLPANEQFYLSKLTSLSLVEVLKEEAEKVTIKWPNDIYVQDKKIAGILIENSVKGNFMDSSIMGMGVNINQEKFYSDAPNPVSLKQLTGKDYDVEKLAEKLLRRIEFWYAKLKTGKLKEIDNFYFSSLYRINKWSVYKKGDQLFEARIAGIGEFGQLILEDRSGNATGYLFKEIEFVI